MNKKKKTKKEETHKEYCFCCCCVNICIADNNCVCGIEPKKEKDKK